MSAYVLLTREYERVKGLRDKADEERQSCLDRAEELHIYRAGLTEEMGELLVARSAILAAKRRAEQNTDRAREVVDPAISPDVSEGDGEDSAAPVTRLISGRGDKPLSRGSSPSETSDPAKERP